jgi:hypothetical protein
MVQAEAGISIVGLSVSLLALGYDHVMCVVQCIRVGCMDGWMD